MQVEHADVAVVGGGIVGLAVALAAARRSEKVVLFERTDPAVGASIRNFGLIWPVGQPGGALCRRALRSREIWLELHAKIGLWCVANGSLHLAYRQDEEDVLVEYLESEPAAGELGATLVSPRVVAQLSPAVRPDGLRGALWSPAELNVDPREAIRTIPGWLAREFGVELRFGTLVRGIALPIVETSAETWHAGRIFVCSGPDFETLYPAEFAASGITRCKLQMLRTVPQPESWQLGPSLCAGLTLLHYDAFSRCRSLAALRARVTHEMPLYVTRRIHVLLSQTRLGELTIGDSHAYGLTHDPFDREEINEAILGYLRSFAVVPSFEIAERWHGIYPIARGKTELILHPEPGVTIVNGLAGAGMTLSFGLAEEIVAA